MGYEWDALFLQTHDKSDSLWSVDTPNCMMFKEKKECWRAGEQQKNSVRKRCSTLPRPQMAVGRVLKGYLRTLTDHAVVLSSTLRAHSL